MVGYSANTGDPAGDTRFQRWDARLGRSVLRTQDQIAVPAGFRLYDGPVHISNLTARSWPAGSAVLALRSSNSFQMATTTSVRGFRPEAVSYRFLAQVWRQS